MDQPAIANANMDNIHCSSTSTCNALLGHTITNLSPSFTHATAQQVQKQLLQKKKTSISRHKSKHQNGNKTKQACSRP